MFLNCGISKKNDSISKVNSDDNTQDTIRIANEELEYEIIIFEPGH